MSAFQRCEGCLWPLDPLSHQQHPILLCGVVPFSCSNLFFTTACIHVLCCKYSLPSFHPSCQYFLLIHADMQHTNLELYRTPVGTTSQHNTARERGFRQCCRSMSLSSVAYAEVFPNKFLYKAVTKECKTGGAGCNS